ncbi:MAG: protein kinase, partial [Deltaproteobacteria bacterium]|nr:protein kinase [Deltaproteobacteria bacterium]
MIITGKLDQPLEFSRFLLTAKIAAGGMATVYLAEARPGDPLHGRRLAVKVLHDHLAEDDDFVRMFRDEGRIAALFDHANVVRVFEVGEWQGSHFLLMEFVEGRDLAQLIQALRLHKQVMAAGIAFEILRQALTALSYVHSFKAKNGKSAGVVHRDISPQNLLISRHPLVKLTDFGIARGSHRSDRTRTGTIKGKMHYMAPEQALGERVDARADLYSLGAVAFEMLTGQAAFGPSNTELAHRRVIEGDVEFNAKFRQQPEDVRAWLCRAMARNPEDRFQSADAMLAAMEQLGRAARTLYRPEALLRLLELPEASRSVQRQAQRALFVGDEAANLGRLAGAVTTGTHPGGHAGPGESRVSTVTGRPQNELAAEERAARLLNKPVGWDAPEPELRPVTGVRQLPDARLSQPMSAGTPKQRQRAAELLPAEKVVGKSYQVAPSRELPAVAHPADAAPLLPHKFGSEGQEPTVASEPDSKAPAVRTSTKVKVLRSEVDQRRGMAMATAVAWMCGAFILFAVLLEVVGWTPELPTVDERSVAALFDTGESDTAVGPAALESEPHSGARGDGSAPVGRALPPVFEAPRAVPAVPPADAATPTDALVDDAEAKAAAERRMRKLIDRGVERDLWDARPIDRVIAADAPDPDRPAQPKAAKVAKPAVAGAAKLQAVAAAPVAPAPAVKVVAAARPVEHAAKPSPPAAKPGQPVGKPVQAAAKAPQAAGKPIQAAGKPVQMAGKPIQAAGKPIQAAGKPIQAAGKPIQAAGKPIQAAGKPILAAGKPVQAGARPIQAAAKPVPAAGKPVQAAGKPIQPAAKAIPGAARARQAPVKPAVAAKPGKAPVKPLAGAKPVAGKP